jgi:hypothetical protein
MPPSTRSTDVKNLWIHTYTTPYTSTVFPLASSSHVTFHGASEMAIKKEHNCLVEVFCRSRGMHFCQLLGHEHAGANTYSATLDGQCSPEPVGAALIIGRCPVRLSPESSGILWLFVALLSRSGKFYNNFLPNALQQ